MTKSPQRGFSLVELMVALALSLVLMAGVLSVFMSSKVTYFANENTARLQENGRIALDMVLHDVRSAGYQGCARMKRIPFWNALNSSTSALWDFGTPMTGYEFTNPGTWTPSLDAAALGLVPAPVDGSDVIALRVTARDAQTIRMTTSMASATANPVVTHTTPAPVQNGQVMLITDCNTASVFQVTGYNAGQILHAAGAGTPGNSSTNLGFVFRTSPSRTTRLIRMETVFYWVGDAGTGPVLYRKTGAAVPQPLVEGVESLQFAYGEDTTGDRVVDQYVAAEAVADWQDIVGVTVSTLLRSDEIGTDVDSETYSLLDPLDDAQGGATLGPFDDRRQRMLFNSTATLRSYAR
jgi:type IV pilus assembly protein PilW